MERLHLTPEFVQAVRDAIVIEDLAADHTQLKKQGNRYQGLCPFHREKTPSFSVDPEQGLYYCFGCGAGGDAIGLHMQLTGDDFPAAMETLASRFGVPIPRTSSRPRSRAPVLDLDAALAAANDFFRQSLAASGSACRYLEARQIEAELIARFELGYAPDDWRQLHDALHPRIPLNELEAAGLVARSEPSQRAYDRFRNRLMFPIHTASGALVGFGGRTLGEDRAKYLNSRETERFQKGHLLYGLHRARRAIREAGRVLLVEGYFDVLAAVAAGVEETVASMGTALTSQQIKLLARYADEVILGYDGDRAGEEACRKALPQLLAEGLLVRRAEFPAGQDPDSLRQEEGVEAVRAVVEAAPDAVLCTLEQLPRDLADQPRAQAAAAGELRALLAAARDRTLAYSYGRRAAERIGLPVEVFWQAGGDRWDAPAPAASGEKRRPPVSTGKGPPAPTEARCLQLLLAVETYTAAGRLPPPAAFLDPVSREIYSALRDVMTKAGASDRKDRARAVRALLPPIGPAIDRLAELLLQEPVQSGAGELAEKLQALERRYVDQRNRELAREIRMAQRSGEDELLLRLIEEKEELRRQLHPKSGPRAS